MKIIYKLLLKYHIRKVNYYSWYRMFENDLELTMYQWCYNGYFKHKQKVKYYNDLVSKKD